MNRTLSTRLTSVRQENKPNHGLLITVKLIKIMAFKIMLTPCLKKTTLLTLKQTAALEMSLKFRHHTLKSSYLTLMIPVK